MSAWNQSGRDRAYTGLCDAITAAGEKGEPLFLARLCLLLMEEIGDVEMFEKILKEAQLADDGNSIRSTRE